MGTEEAYFGAGCFWHVQKEFDNLPVKTLVGYMGGKENKYPSPDYEQICNKNTGYIETVKVIFNPREVSYKEILNKFWRTHDPNSKDRQGQDIGHQYRSVIFYTSKEQKEKAEKSKNKREEEINHPIVTEIREAKTFFKAKDYHQKYYKK